MPTFWIEDGCVRAKDLTPGSLQDSIAKWEFISKLDLVELDHLLNGGLTTCALCMKYHEYYEPEPGGCIGCPVYQRTNLRGCDGTPYHYFVESSFPHNKRRYAIEELEFLKSLQAEDNNDNQ